MSSPNQRNASGGKNTAYRHKTQRIAWKNLEEGFCILSPGMEVLELDKVMRKRFPHIDLEGHPLCFQVFPHPPRQAICPRCPSFKTLKDGKIHRATITIRDGKGGMKVRATAVPVKDARGKVMAVIERIQNGDQKPPIGAKSKKLAENLKIMSPKPCRTPQKVLERELREETRRLRALLETTNALTSSLDNETILRIIGDTTKELLEADGCTIYLLDSTGRKLKPIFTNEEDLVDKVLAFELKVGEGLSGKVAVSGVARIVNHAEKDEEICVQIPGTPLEPECLLSAPLISKEKVVGVMTLNRDGAREFHQKDLELLTIFAHQVSGIVENARLYHRLKESEERYRGIFENSRDTLYITDKEGRILAINPAGRKTLGLERRRAIGRRLDAFFLNSKRRAEMYQQIRGVGFVKDMEVQIKTANDEVLDVLETSTTLKGPDGTVMGFTGIIRDITERKKLQEELAQSQKLEAIGRLAGGVAHDFNNLLSGILGYASYAKSLVSQNSKMWKTLDMIQKSSEKAADLTRQLLGFSRRAKYQIETVNVNELIGEVLELIGRTINRNVVVKQKLDPHLPPIDADATQIQQAILNLCINANEAMASTGGRLILETKSIFLKKGDTSQLHLNSPPGRYLQISISDTGVGMDEATRGKIFEPFFTTKEESKGTGLGLALAYGIVKSHGGGITCYSTPGCGSVFHIYLPISKDGACQPKHKRTTKDMELPPGHETILVVDDEEVVRHLAKDVLKSLGYQVILAASGREAIRLYRQRSDDIALVVLDMIMPQLGGEETYARLKKINPKVKVVLSSGYAHDGTSRRLLREGVANFIQKPYTMGCLAQVVRETLDM